ncbi:MAG: oligosaccharide flippase family protein [Acidobacteria bacterium]|nr:oligosaccharide flippase family protein [Acidobacteriota bacterium]
MKTFRDAKYVTSSAIVAVALTAIRSLLVLRIVGPAVIGAWKAAMLLYTTGEFLRLGVSRGIALQVPVLDGQGEQKQSDRLAAAAGSFVLLVGVVAGIGFFLASFFITDRELRLAFQLVSVVMMLGQPHQFLRDLVSARHSFQLRAKELLLAASIDFGAGLTLAWLFGLPGIGIATMLAVGVPAVYLWRKQGFHFHLHIDRPSLKRLVNVGFPFSLAETAFDFARFLDVLVMTPLLGPVVVGYYAVSLLILDFSTFVTKLGISQVVAPHLLRAYGKAGSAREVEVFYEMPVRLFSYVLPPLIAVGSLMIGEFVRLVLPQYTPGIPAAQITMWGIFFMAVHSTIGSFFLAAKKLREVLRLFAVLLPAGAVAHIIVIKAGYGLTGVAWTSLAVLAVASSAEIWIARRSCGHSPAEITGFLASLYFPIGAAMLITSLVQDYGFTAGGSEVLTSIVKASLITGLYVPLFLVYENRFSLLRTVRQTA